MVLSMKYRAEHLRTLADHVLARRLELGMRRKVDLARAAGLSERKIGAIERAERKGIGPNTLAGLDRALQWVPGSARRLADTGQPPTPLEDPSARRTLEDAVRDSNLPDDDKAALLRLIKADGDPQRAAM